MKYQRMTKGRFIERPNRFIAHIEINGIKEVVHVKNTGRCRELLLPGVTVYVQRADNPERKTQWDLIAVQKGERIINMDSQVPNQIVREWLERGNMFDEVQLIRPEVTYGKSRFDLYVETLGQKAFVEVKGVTLEQDGMVMFPDAPSERAVKHVRELCQVVKEGYEAYIFFAVQMEGVKYFTPNAATDPEFTQALKAAQAAGVRLLAYECAVKADEIHITKEVPIILEEPRLYEMVEPLVAWYRQNCRQLPWRERVSAYHTWVSEIMLQQTRVEAVKPFYHRFMEALPTVDKLADAKEDELLKLWEGLGYYNRIRNMQIAAQQVMEEFGGQFPQTYEEIQSLKGIGSYTAGAISSIAFGIPKPAVDGNVLRVISRILASDEDIMKASVKKRIEAAVEEVIPKGAASDFNQGLIELGALVCVPNGAPKCGECPVQDLCLARAQGRQTELPVKKKAKARRIEQKTIFLLKDGENLAIQKRPAKGLLPGLYEFPQTDGWLNQEEAIAYVKTLGITPLHIQELPEAKHIFSHVEWHMRGYAIRVDQLAKIKTKEMLFIHPEQIEDEYPIPAAFGVYSEYADIKLGIKGRE